MDNTIVIPELEAIATPMRRQIYWSEEELNVLRSYYGRIPHAKLSAYFKQHFGSIRTENSMAQMYSKIIKES